MLNWLWRWFGWGRRRVRGVQAATVTGQVGYRLGVVAGLQPPETRAGATLEPVLRIASVTLAQVPADLARSAGAVPSLDVVGTLALLLEAEATLVTDVADGRVGAVLAASAGAAASAVGTGLGEGETVAGAAMAGRLTVTGTFWMGGLMLAGTLEPLSDAELRIAVKDKAGVPLTGVDAVVECTAYNPRREVLGTAAQEAGWDAAAAAYVLAIPAEWSDENPTVPTGKALPGEYLVLVHVTSGDLERTTRLRYAVRFTE